MDDQEHSPSQAGPTSDTSATTQPDTSATTQSIEERAAAPHPLRFDLPQFLGGEAEVPRVRVPIAPLPVRARPRGVRAVLTHWRVKGVVQRLLGSAPGGRQLHAMLQRRLGGLRQFERECAAKVEDWRLMMLHLRTARIEHTRASMLEIGTGWYPTLPICWYLAGAPLVRTIDVEPKLDPALTLRLVEELARYLLVIAHGAGVPLTEVIDRHARLRAALARGGSLARATQFAIDYRAPADATQTELSAGTVDVVFSNSVLEHIPPDVIDACFGEAMRILRPGGVMVHSVNCGDHYAYFDPRLSQLNYLAYSDEAWAKWNNAFLYQNRLRAIDFTTRCAAAGFQVELDTSRPHPQRLPELDQIEVHPRFAHYTREQLAITSVDFIGRKPASAPEN